MTSDPTLVDTLTLLRSLHCDLLEMPWSPLVAEARITIAELERRARAESPRHD